MHETVIKPRTSEINAAGHVGNTVVPIWFEEGRNEFLQSVFAPVRFRYMLARIEQNFRKEMHYGTDVFIRTAVDRIGNSSLALVQEVWQKGTLCAEGRSVLVHINGDTKRPTTITDGARESLSGHIKVADPS